MSQDIRRRTFLRLTGATAAAPLLGSLLPPTVARADEGEAAMSVLDEQLAGGPPELMLNRHLMRQVAQAEQRIEETAAAIDTPEKLEVWQRRVHGAFVEALGGAPERTPLNPQIVETIQGDGYRVEKLLYESRPKHYVTAALFLPDEEAFAAPWPAILVPCGHSERPRDRALYQRPCVMAARNGMAALLYDPTDQGERMQRLDEQGNYSVWGTRGHNRFGLSAALLGMNAASFLVWDGIRGLDYLESRDDIAGDKLGCMGISGGGTMTAYLTALDDRIKAAAPACYISTLREVYAAIGPQDAEQNIHSQLAFGMDHAEMLTLAAPRAVRVCATTNDFFPIAGARQAYERARSVYERVGYGDRISFFEDVDEHNWSEPLCIASITWMNRWLRGTDRTFIPDEEQTGITAEQMKITEHGQVMRLSDARSVDDVMQHEADRLAAARQGTARDADPVHPLRQAVRKRAGIRPLTDIPKPTVETHDETATDWGTIRRLTFAFHDDLLLPAVLFLPRQAEGAVQLAVDGRGKAAADASAREAAAAGDVVLAVDLSGFGETQGTESSFYGSNAEDDADAMIAYVLGRSLTGMRAEDILGCARWLAAQQGQDAVNLNAASWAVTPALHAAVAEPGLFASVVLADRPMPWREVVAAGDAHRYSDVVHGALRDYDLDDLEAAINQ